jgi:hypothetical protein
MPADLYPNRLHFGQPYYLLYIGHLIDYSSSPSVYSEFMVYPPGTFLAGGPS